MKEALILEWGQHLNQPLGLSNKKSMMNNRHIVRVTDETVMDDMDLHNLEEEHLTCTSRHLTHHSLLSYVYLVRTSSPTGIINLVTVKVWLKVFPSWRQLEALNWQRKLAKKTDELFMVCFGYVYVGTGSQAVCLYMLNFVYIMV